MRGQARELAKQRAANRGGPYQLELKPFTNSLLAATARALTATPASTATPTSTAAPAAVFVMAAAGMCDRRTVKRCGEEKRYGWRCDDGELSTGCQEFAAIRVRVIFGSMNFRHADSSWILTTAH